MNLDHCIFCNSPYNKFELDMVGETTMDYLKCDCCDRTWKYINKDGSFRSVYFQFGDNKTGITLSIRYDNSWYVQANGYKIIVGEDDALNQWNTNDPEEMKCKIEMYELMA